MNRVLRVWLVFGACAGVMLAATGWLSAVVLRLEAAQRQAARQAELEERARLALWRMDSAVMALLVEESARPADVYSAYYEFQNAFNRKGQMLQQGEVVVPSPLLAYVSSNVLLHFQWRPGRPLTSPQVPERARPVQTAAGPDTLQRQTLFAGRLRQMEALLARPAAGQKSASLTAGEWLWSEAAGRAVVAVQAPVRTEDAQQFSQAGRSSAELNVRAQVSQAAQQQAFGVNNSVASQEPARPQPANRAPASEGVFRPLWVEDQLVLARRIEAGGVSVLQGCWLDWPRLRQSLLAGVRDLLPAADLTPAPAAAGAAPARQMATLPARLMPGPVDYGRAPGWSVARVSLGVAWVCVLMAVGVAAAVAGGIVSLSERRAAFVSAVTHELRTPLTTFKLYTEMLAGGMVEGEAQRMSYLQTLRAEAERLGHLVENVLAYARLEKGGARRRGEAVALGALLERVKPRLAGRAAQAGLVLCEEASSPAGKAVVRADVSAVEQILFNLVDNACKYAAAGPGERALHLELAAPNGKSRSAVIRVRDHGPGIAPEARRRLFEPFSKSSRQAAESAPGVGLGLALSRRLSRELGGDLRWQAGAEEGACFELVLPLEN